MAAAATRLSPRERRRDRAQPRSAPARGRPPSDGAFDRARRRAAAVVAPARQLHRRALVPVGERDVPYEWRELRDSGLPRLERPDLLRNRVLVELARRPAADRA